ncbi:MAG: restriction endonuclease subunit S [Balneola sp.]
MSSEEVFLKDIVEFNPSYSLNKGEEYKYVEMAAIPEGVKEIDYFEIKEYKGGSRFKNGETLFARITPCLENGKTALVNVLNDNEVGFGSTEFIILKPKEPQIDQEFVYYLCRYPEFRLYAQARMEGTSGRQRVSWQALEEYERSLPNSITRKAIGDYLKVFDDKIHLNQQTNETLETMAQAIFKSWFVDFDPVHAKIRAVAEGYDPIRAAMAIIAGISLEQDWGDIEAALTQKLDRMTETLRTQLRQTAELFPESFTYNETLLKQVPKGWKDTNLAKCLKSVSKTFDLKSAERVVFLNTGDIQAGKFLHENYSNTEGLPGQAKKSIRKGDILYSEIRPKNKRFAYVHFDSADYVVSTKLMVLRPKNSIDPLFYYQILKSESTVKELQYLAESRSGTFPQITYDTLKAIRFVIPNQKNILDHFIKVLSANFERLIQNEKQNEALTDLRDTLLPRLISGEVEV